MDMNCVVDILFGLGVWEGVDFGGDMLWDNVTTAVLRVEWWMMVLNGLW